MALAATLRVNAQVPFPSRVTGSNVIDVSKTNGIWDISLDYTLVGYVGQPPAAQLQYSYLLFYNSATGVYATIKLTDLAAIAGTPSETIVTHADSPYTVLAADSFLSVDSSGGAVIILLAPAVDRAAAGGALTIKDAVGSAFTHSIVVTPDGTETIDGAAFYTIENDYGGITIVPRASNNTYLVKP